MYPDNWPKCSCGEPCMDGKDTCGRVECLLHSPRVRPGTLNAGEFIRECGKAMGYVPPPPGAEAFTDDGRFVSGDGYGGERF